MLAAVAQICSGQSIAANLASCIGMMRQAASQSAKIVFLPESSDFLGNPPEEALELAQDLDKAPFVTGICQEAKQLGLFVSVGLHEKSPQPGRLYNTHIIINNLGQIIQTYRKIHLFDVSILNGPQLQESKNTLAGTMVQPPISSPIGKIGLGICYDLRFPELASSLRNFGAEILTYPSAFTIKTGQAHWEILLRARAIETQSFVIASAQVGQHSEKRASYGHAMIVDPWGKILVECSGQEPGLAVAEIDLEELKRIRLEMPVWSHKRPDTYK